MKRVANAAGGAAGEPSRLRNHGLSPAATALLVLLGCGGLPIHRDASPHPPSRADGAPTTRDSGALPAEDASMAPDGDAGAPPSSELALVGSPLAFGPTAHGFGLNAILTKGSPTTLRAHVRAAGTTEWGSALPPTVRSADVAEWSFDGLSPSLRYEYELIALDPAGDQTICAGSTVTQRQAGEAFTFALISDSHIGSDLSYSNQGIPDVLRAVSGAVAAASPDFMVHLGDMLDFHEYGFNDPPPEGSITRQAYLNYRMLLGDTLGRVSHFATIGNWEGEDGWYTAEELALSRQQRLLYMPGPSPATYPEGGSAYQDYYAFTWGDALFIVLNVMSYTPIEHLLGSGAGLPDDWTLGPDQLAWLGTTLANATSRWRFLLIHHAVGGKAGDDADSAYGRGGGQAANVGEQATVHQLMLKYGAQIFFYGHDHVFTDMTVDGIHYSDPGNAGAPWTFGTELTGYVDYWPDSGWAKVTVTPSSVNVQFISQTGDLLHQYSVP